jgi:sulfide:quinone oxidoreductase
VAIIGGGVAALEAMLALDVISYSATDVHLFSPNSRFVLKPLAVSTGLGRGEMLNFDLAKLTSTAGATFHNLSVSGVVTEDRIINLSDGSEFSYDYLIASPGTEPLPAVPGATTYTGPAANQTVAEALETLRGQENVRVIVTMPDGASWPLPLYELALLIKDQLGPAAAMTIVSPERSPLELFGKAAAETVAGLLRDRDIATVFGTAPSECLDGALVTGDGKRIEADLTLALPLLTGRRIDGLPYDEKGFIPVDDLGQIEGHGREFAAGDVTSFPVKFGGIATEQADVVAAAVAAAAQRKPAPRPFAPVYRATMVTAEGLIDLGPGVKSSLPYAWDPAEKIHGKYLMPFLKAADPATLGAG